MCGSTHCARAGLIHVESLQADTDAALHACLACVCVQLLLGGHLQGSCHAAEGPSRMTPASREMQGWLQLQIGAWHASERIPGIVPQAWHALEMSSLRTVSVAVHLQA